MDSWAFASVGTIVALASLWLAAQTNAVSARKNSVDSAFNAVEIEIESIRRQLADCIRAKENMLTFFANRMGVPRESLIHQMGLDIPIDEEYR